MSIPGPHDPTSPMSTSLSRRQAFGLGAAVVGGLGFSTFTPSAAAASAPVMLADARGAYATVVVPVDADAEVRLASEELVSHVALATGQNLAVANDAPTSGLAVRLGAAARAGSWLPSDLKTQEYVVEVGASGIDIVGGSSLAVRFGVYAILEEAGFRWIMPGPDGTDVPPRREVQLRGGLYRSAPFFPHRALQNVDTYPNAPAFPAVDRTEGKRWTERMRLDSVALGAHGIPLYPPATRATNPELFIKVGGVTQNQLDVTNPEVLTRAVAAARRTLQANPTQQYLSMGPNDGAGFGETAWDIPGRIDPLNGELVVTDRLVKFFNLILDALPEYPHVRLAFYAYHLYLEPPLREKPNPRLVPILAPIAVSRRTSMKDGNGWERRYVLRVLREWSALGVDVMYRGYLGNLADPSGPFSAVDQLAHEIPLMAKSGIRGAIRLENIQGWGHAAPSYYLASKLFWDPTLPVDELLRDYYVRAFGPAATLIRRYFETVQNHDAQVDFTGGGIFDLPEQVPGVMLDEMGRLLSQAEKAVGGAAPYAGRIAVIRKAYDVGRAHVETQRLFLGAETPAGFRAAKARYDETVAAFSRAALSKPAAVLPFTTLYMPRYLGQAVTEADLYSHAPNEFVTAVGEEWRLLIDSRGDAEAEKVYAADADLSTWTTAHTARSLWSAQGLRYYKGDAWYATEVTLPAIPAGRSLALWLGIVDEAARVWVNGNEITAMVGARGLWPARFAVGGAARPGINRVVVKVRNVVLDELGTGGLMSRSYFYTSPTSEAPPVALPPVTGAALVGEEALSGRAAAGLDVGDDWELLLTSFGGAERLGLFDPRIGSEHWRPYTISKGFVGNGLKHYRGGAVLRARLQSLRGHRGLHIPAADGQVEVWLDGQALRRRSGESGASWTFDLPHPPSSKGWLVIAFTGGSSEPNNRGIAGPIRLTR